MADVAYRSRRVLLDDGSIKPATIVVKNGKITSIIIGQDGNVTSPDDVGLNAENNIIQSYQPDQIVDFGDDLLMTGVVDSHVHVNEPGRIEWEGFETATRAAAVGGITTIVDMPLNSIPATTSLAALRTKREAASGKCFVDVGFWGGVVPGNEGELKEMIKAGVCGFKCFMIHSGIDEFQHVEENDIRKTLQALRHTNSALLFHAELPVYQKTVKKAEDHFSDSSKYETFLESRPDEMEVRAIQQICQLCAEYGVRCHIVHLSSSAALQDIVRAKSLGAPLTVETTHHYLTLNAENVPEKATQYKCCPPIRSLENQEKLWNGIKERTIDMVVSDHSPCTPDLKLLDEGDFMKAWGGIASIQFGLSLFWTNVRLRGLHIADIARLLCRNTALLAGLGRQKGAMREGYDADFVVWDPEATFKIEEENIYHKNKVTPYLNWTLYGLVKTTIVRGQIVFDKGHTSSTPLGKFVAPAEICE